MKQQAEHLQLEENYPAMIGNSPAIREVNRFIERIGPTSKPVLVQGESGTGKEVVAKALHRASYLSEKPIAVLNCTASPEQMLEIELFGNEMGMRNGDNSAQRGLFEIANDGTLFIDNIGEVGEAFQSKLLRVLEDGAYRRVGSVHRNKVQVRLITATNRDLMQEVKLGRFREDLLYRINVFSIVLPPLRHRKEDIVPLVHEFCGEGWHVPQQVMSALEKYEWPGNIRQLKNAIQRAKVLSKDNTISMQDLPPGIESCIHQSPIDPALAETNLDILNKKHITQVLQQFHGNKSRSAEALGIGRRTLYRLIKKFGIT